MRDNTQKPEQQMTNKKLSPKRDTQDEKQIKY